MSEQPNVKVCYSCKGSIHSGGEYVLADRVYRVFPDPRTRKPRTSFKKAWAYFHVKTECLTEVERGETHICEEMVYELGAVERDILEHAGFQLV